MISELRTGHEMLVSQLERVHSLVRDYPKAKGELRNLENYLLKHVSYQNKNFYNSLQVSHKDSREALKMLEFLEQDLREFKIKIITFFEFHPADMADVKPGLFISHFVEFYHDILARVKIENDYLFPLLEKA